MSLRNINRIIISYHRHSLKTVSSAACLFPPCHGEYLYPKTNLVIEYKQAKQDIQY